MTSCGSSSSRRIAIACALLAAAALAGCAAPRPRVGPESTVSRFAIFPPVNLTGSAGETDGLVTRLATEFARAGVEVVYGEPVDEFLHARRLRYTGGVSGEVALAAREALGVDAIVVTTLSAHGMIGGTPVIALTTRVVSLERNPRILWMDGAELAGNDDPGPLGLFLIHDMPSLERKAASALGASLRAFLTGNGPRARACAADRRFAPKAFFRAPELAPPTRRPTVAVVPFRNESTRDGADEIMAAEFTRHLLATGQYDVLESGELRETLLRFRIIMERGVSRSTAASFYANAGADFVLGGEVHEYADANDGRAAGVRFNAVLLDGQTGELVWSATSYHQGDDSVLLFERGRLDVAGPLACSMVSAAVLELPLARPMARNHVVAR
jgi:hypothetical protein